MDSADTRVQRRGRERARHEGVDATRRRRRRCRCRGQQWTQEPQELSTEGGTGREGGRAHEHAAAVLQLGDAPGDEPSYGPEGEGALLRPVIVHHDANLYCVLCVCIFVYLCPQLKRSFMDEMIESTEGKDNPSTSRQSPPRGAKRTSFVTDSPATKARLLASANTSNSPKQQHHCPRQHRHRGSLEYQFDNDDSGPDYSDSD